VTPNQQFTSRNRLRELLVGKHPSRTLRRAIVLAVLAYVIARYVFLPVHVQGMSMLPTFKDGTIHVANLLKYTWHEPRRGDIVLISLTGTRALYLKRILGLPGETIEFRNGELLVNGEPLAEPYVKGTNSWDMPRMTILPREYFVAGDNRSIPINLHTLGTVDRTKIAGGILF